MEINGNKKMPVESVDKMSTKNHKVSSIVETLDFKQFLSHRSSEMIFNEVAPQTPKNKVDKTIMVLSKVRGCRQIVGSFFVYSQTIVD